jgi:hypothetical protein
MNLEKKNMKKSLSGKEELWLFQINKSLRKRKDYLEE